MGVIGVAQRPAFVDIGTVELLITEGGNKVPDLYGIFKIDYQVVVPVAGLRSLVPRQSAESLKLSAEQTYVLRFRDPCYFAIELPQQGRRAYDVTRCTEFEYQYLHDLGYAEGTAGYGQKCPGYL